MQRIILFLIRNQYKVVFSLLFGISVILIINQHFYHKFRFLSSKNWICGQVLDFSTGFSSYLSLKQHNESLVRENQALREGLLNLKTEHQNMDAILHKDSLKNYHVFSAYVIKNSFSKIRNYITIDKGAADGIKRDMAVINSKGIVGIVENTSQHFSTIQSVLNERTMINAKIKGTNSFGTLKWNTKDFRIVQLEDIPTFVGIKLNDTVVTAGMSHIFPKNIPIGSIDTIQVLGNYYSINVRLFSNMVNLGYVYVIDHTMRNEIQELEEETEDGK